MTTSRKPRPGAPTAAPPPSQLADRTFAHPHLQRVVDHAVSALTRPGGKQLVALYGPPGAGKSHACRIIENTLAHHWRKELEADASVVPVVRVEAPAAVGREFAWRNFLEDCLRKVNDPAVGRLVDPAELGGPAPLHTRPSRLSANELLGLAMVRYRDRQVRVLIIDEAQHIAAAANPTVLRHHLDVLKAFANLTGVRILLAGTYELLDFHRASAQLSRRLLELHLPRYRWTLAHERRAWDRLVRDMLGCIDGIAEVDIAQSVESCYERSIGCVGELRDWLVQAEHEFRTSGRSWGDCLADTTNSTSKAAAMLNDVEASERRLRAADARRDELRVRLGMETLPSPTKRSVTTKPVPAPTVTARRRAGRRNPTRDAVGVADDAA